MNYDALLIVSFGGPESRQDVLPFMENVLRGKNVPRDRMMEVAEHYYEFDGVSPINEQNRKLIAALEQELSRKGPSLPIYWGNRNWHPLLNDTVKKMADDGVRRALAFVTSAFSSYSGCRQYREDLARARKSVGRSSPKIDKLRVFYNHPGFVQANVDHVIAAFESLPEEEREKAELIFTAHSLPMAMARNCDYEIQLEESCRLVGEALDRDWTLVYQSRSGPPSQPWLEPDIVDYLEDFSERGGRACVVSPIGFISDHMEVLYDLDTEAKDKCEELEIEFARAATPGVHPLFIQMIRELILERMNQSPVRRYLGDHGPSHDFCPPGCCLAK